MGNFCSLFASETRIDTDLVFVSVVNFCVVELMHLFPENRFVFFIKLTIRLVFVALEKHFFDSRFFQAEMDQNHSFV